MKNILRGALIVLLTCSWSAGAVGAENSKEQEKVKKQILKHLDEKAKFSGTLDIFDKKNEKVRNLKLLKADDVTIDGNDITAEFEYRDVNSAELVEVKILAKKAKKGVTIDDIQISQVQTFREEEIDAKPELTDEEARQVMKDYIDAQSRFTGYFSYFDIKRETMRKLQLVEIDQNVRRYGALYISNIMFKDMDTGDMLNMVFTVQYKKGKAKVKNVRVDTIKKPKKPKE